jgi:hypothetical protein
MCKKFAAFLDRATLVAAGVVTPLRTRGACQPPDDGGHAVVFSDDRSEPAPRRDAGEHGSDHCRSRNRFFHFVTRAQ